MIHFYNPLQPHDVNEVYELLNKLKFPSYNERQGSKMASGRTLTFGFVWVVPTRRGNQYPLWGISRASATFPKVQIALHKLIKHIDPQFDYTTIQINKNTVCNPHIDDDNTGESILLSIGDYQGGNICIKNGDTIDTISTNHQPIRFDGSQFYHWNTSIQSGTKYSIVFYNRRKNKERRNFTITTNYKEMLENPSIEPMYHEEQPKSP